jgi:hypothetical protein
MAGILVRWPQGATCAICCHERPFHFLPGAAIGLGAEVLAAFPCRRPSSTLPRVETLMSSGLLILVAWF